MYVFTCVLTHVFIYMYVTNPDYNVTCLYTGRGGAAYSPNEPQVDEQVRI